jgi:hypothetical protein
MRRPIRSHVANRRMFQGGGLSPLPQPTGILASSQPLVDQVAQNAMSPNPIRMMNEGGLGLGMFAGMEGPKTRSIKSMTATPQAELFKRSDAPRSAWRRALRQGEDAVEFAWKRYIEAGADGSTPLILEDGTIIIGNPDGSGGQLYVKGRGSGEDIYEVPLKPGLTRENIGLRESVPVNIRGFPGEPDVVEKLDFEGRPLVAEVIEQEKISPEEIIKNISQLQSSKADVADLAEMIETDSIDTNVDVDKLFDKSEPTIVKKDKKEGEKDGEVIVLDPVIVTGEITGEGVGMTAGIEDEAIFTEKEIKKAANANDTEKTVKTIADYKKEFVKAMPEYEGMSNDEKAFAWIKMGMAVAAGTSPNAIKNIADGVLATLDEFSDDPKKKRAYEQQVLLAGSKYALERLNNDRTILSGIAKEQRELLPYVALKDFTHNGKEYGKGQTIQITRGEFDRGVLGNFPPGTVGDLAVFGDMEDTLQAIQAFNQAKLGSGTKMSDWISERDLYLNTLNSMKSGLHMRLYLGEAAELINSGKVLGASGYLRQGLDRVLNALKIDPKTLRELRSTDRDMYNAKMKQIGTQMLTKILNEGTKTISDQDRKRVEELIATMTDFAAGTVSIHVVNEKILALDNQIEKGLYEDGMQLGNIEATWAGDVRVKGVNVSPTQVLAASRKALFPQQGQRVTSTGAIKTFKFEDIWDVEKNVFKTGIDWG